MRGSDGRLLIYFAAASYQINCHFRLLGVITVTMLARTDAKKSVNGFIYTFAFEERWNVWFPVNRPRTDGCRSSLVIAVSECVMYKLIFYTNKRSFLSDEYFLARFTSCCTKCTCERDKPRYKFLLYYRKKEFLHRSFPPTTTDFHRGWLCMHVNPYREDALTFSNINAV